MKVLKWKFSLIAILLVASVLLATPSFYRHPPSWWKRFFPSEGFRLGLDLQGGMHLILKVDVDKAVRNGLELAGRDLKEMWLEKDIPLTRLEEDTSHLVYILPNVEVERQFKHVIGDQFPNLVLVSSVKEGNIPKVTLKLADREIEFIRKNAVDQTLEIIRNRIDQFGVTEPAIVRHGEDEIVVQLPGIKDPERALSLIGQTAQLEFKLLDEDAGLDPKRLIHDLVGSGRLKEGYSTDELNEALRDTIPAGDEVLFLREVDWETGITRLTPMLLKSKVLMTGDMVKDARVNFGRYSEPYVSLEFTKRGSHVFERITSENVGKRLAIILDKVVRSAPNIRERIAGGRAQITGSFTAEEAHDLAIVLRAGSLPAPVYIVQNVTVGPGLGLDSIHKGFTSGLIGSILVVSFMVFYYRASGVIANGALFLNIILLLGALAALRATLTLPGIAGIVLSIGMGVDSNVLIFERMREEFRSGRPIKSGVDAGYSRATGTIMDAQITTLIAAAALFLFGTGPIRGFAVTLSLGIVLNLFTVLFGTKIIYDYLNLKRKLKRLKFVELIKSTEIDFLGLRRYSMVISAALVFLGLMAFVQIYLGRANLGVDFAGGTLIQYRSLNPVSLDKIRNVLVKNGLRGCELQQVAGTNALIVKMKKRETAVGEEADTISAIFAKEFPENPFTIESKTEIGASVSDALRKAAIVAIVISLAGVIIYLALRFDFRFGVAAAIATFHDVLAVLGIFYVLNKEITLLIVTALLTLAGYSLNDTVVVFDRVRENLLKKGKNRPSEIMNISINEVLSRTIITSLTTLFVLMALLLLGGVVLHDFALALFIGLIVGNYSSIFVACAIVYQWRGEKKAIKRKT